MHNAYISYFKVFWLFSNTGIGGWPIEGLSALGAGRGSFHLYICKFTSATERTMNGYILCIVLDSSIGMEQLRFVAVHLQLIQILYQIKQPMTPYAVKVFFSVFLNKFNSLIFFYCL